jgi:hypothetical protein
MLDVSRWTLSFLFATLTLHESPFAIMSPSPGKSFFSRIGKWVAELLLVFIGAYAAFWLNNYQQRQEEIRRHDQLLAALEDEVNKALQSAKTEGAKEQKVVAEFRRQLDAGEMPPLAPFSFTSDYSATDVASLLQSGGYQLLDVKTLVAIRQVESTVRGGLTAIEHYQRLSDELIVPNLGQDISFFYDPTTKKLRKRFAGYPEVLEMVARFFNDYTKAETDLLNQIHAERQRR